MSEKITKIQFNMPTSNGVSTEEYVYAPLAENVSYDDTNVKAKIQTIENSFNSLEQNVNNQITETQKQITGVIDDFKDGTFTAKNAQTAESATTCTGNAATATKLETSVSIGFSGAITATAQNFDGSSGITIPVTAVDGSKITGTIPLNAIPSEALNVKMFHVGNSKPLDTNLLWIDTNTTTGGLKYHNGSSWVHVPMGWA